METRSKSRKASEKEPLPGERQGMSRAGDRHDSEQVASGRGKNGRDPVIQGATVCTIEPYPSSTRTAASVFQGSNPLLPETTLAGRKRVRMKWTTDVNMFIMRTYYKITKLETDFTGYRDHLCEEFKKQYPYLEVTAQRISDQRRAIVRNNLIEPQVLNKIRADVTTELAGAVVHEVDESPDVPAASQPQIASTHEGTLEKQDDYEEQFKKVASDQVNGMFVKSLIEYKGMDPTKRPYIPKQGTSSKLASIVQELNDTVLPQYLEKVETFEDLHTLVYCAAVTAVQLNGAKIKDRNIAKNREEKVPRWRQRIKRKIEILRAELARMLQYQKGNPSKKLKRQAEGIENKYKMHSTHDKPNLTSISIIDTLKQKITAYKWRLNRYTTCSRRKRENLQFESDERKFYRTLKKNVCNENQIPPKCEEVTRYWSSIWSNSVPYNQTSNWISEEIEDMLLVENMLTPEITVEEVRIVVNETHNWKAAGSDNIHNYWYKKLTCTHSHLAHFINVFFQLPEMVPGFLTEGKTYLLPKREISNDPSKYRPITCLQTVYKIMTACVSRLINAHVSKQNILTEEQKGCRKGMKGCKDQLVVDSVVLKEAHQRNRKLFCCYIDYQKAFDSVPHMWLIDILKIYKIHPALIEFLQHMMKQWRTFIHIYDGNRNEISSEIKIQRGIFQGDSLSPLWFCLALNPLSRLLNRTNIGYHIGNNQNGHQLSHLLYMDDLKLYASSSIKLQQLIQLVEQFSVDINMKFGLEKCKILNSHKVLENSQGLDVQQGRIGLMTEFEFYKYLGIEQSKRIAHTEIKRTLTSEFSTRLERVCRTELNSKNLIKAINTYVISILTYSFGIISWSNTDLENLQRQLRVQLTKHRKHHAKSSTLRVTLPRDEGGRGIIDIKNLHNKQIAQLRSYFHERMKDSSLHASICSSDNNYTPLNLLERENLPNEKGGTEANKILEWKSMALHGRHPHDLSNPNVDKKASNAWLKRGELFPETEGFVIAIQDQVIPTKNYKKYIMLDPKVENDKCRKCRTASETIQHITGACTMLAQTDYLHRHNQVANIIHQALALKYCLIEKSIPYYKYQPANVLESTNFKLYYDRSIITDRTIHNNRPDIVLKDQLTKTTYLIDIAVPNTHNVQKTIQEKFQKYSDLRAEILRIWNMESVYIVPVVMSSTGVIPFSLHHSINTLKLRKTIYVQLQKAVLLNTSRIVRKFLDQPE